MNIQDGFALKCYGHRCNKLLLMIRLIVSTIGLIHLLCFPATVVVQ